MYYTGTVSYTSGVITRGIKEWCWIINTLLLNILSQDKWKCFELTQDTILMKQMRQNFTGVLKCLWIINKSYVEHCEMLQAHQNNEDNDELRNNNPLHVDVECWRQAAILQLFFNRNSDFYCHIWILHEKCIQMSTNKPTLGSVILKITS